MTGGRRKSWLLSLAVVATLFVHNAASAAVLFDFDDAPYLGTESDIEAYMENIYDSDITVVGGRVGNGVIPGPLHNYSGDHYIQAGPSYETSWFSFSFDEVPIIAVSFDWAIELNSLHAYADDVEIFSQGWDWWSSGNSGNIDLVAVTGSAVTTLKFTDSNVWEIEIDNLSVTPVTSVPEPATVFLLGVGATLMTLTRKRSFV